VKNALDKVVKHCACVAAAARVIIEAAIKYFIESLPEWLPELLPELLLF